jgi:hypothetical protein
MLIYQLTPVRTVIIGRKQKVLVRVWGKKEPLHTVCGNVNYYRYQENTIKLPQKN